MDRIRLWFRSWFFWARIIHMTRTKKHGKGKMPLRLSLGMARSTRYIVYGQHYRKKAGSPSTNGAKFFSER